MKQESRKPIGMLFLTIILGLVLEHFFHCNLFAELFGQQAGAVVWFIALVVTWALSGLGFYRIYKVSKTA